MTLFIGKDPYTNVESFHTEYQPQNGKSHWVFIRDFNKHEYAVEYDPRKESIEVIPNENH